MNITIDDLKNGRDFWLWALEDVEKRIYKKQWSEYDRIEKYSASCPLCELVDWEVDPDCQGCPLAAKGLACYSGYRSDPYSIWSNPSNSLATRTQAAEDILDVYNEEIEKMGANDE